MALFIFDRRILESTRAAMVTGIDDLGLAFLLSEEGVHEDDHARYIDKARLQVGAQKAVMLQDTTWRLAGNEHAASGFAARMRLGVLGTIKRIASRILARFRVGAPRALPAQAQARQVEVAARGIAVMPSRR